MPETHQEMSGFQITSMILTSCKTDSVASLLVINVLYHKPALSVQTRGGVHMGNMGKKLGKSCFLDRHFPHVHFPRVLLPPVMHHRSLWYEQRYVLKVKNG